MAGRAVVVLGRLMTRSLGQVALSVMATLIATVLTSGLLEGRRSSVAVPPAPVPAREGPATRPVVGIVDWSVTPLHPVRLVTDPGWMESEGGDGSLGSRLAATPRQPNRRTLRKSVVATAPVLAAISPLPLHDPVSEPGLVSRTATQVQALIASGGTALVSGGTELLHWRPGAR